MKIFYSFLCLLLFTVTGFAQVTLPVDFEDTTIDYQIANFGETASAIVVDPTNMANMVFETTKFNNAPDWGGVVIANGGLMPAIPFSAAGDKFTIRVWSPDAGITIRLKLEDFTDQDIFAEVDAISTVANDWETLEFDFSNLAGGVLDYANTYDKLVLFFNYGVTGADAGEKTYYCDDITFIPAPPPVLDLPITFENEMPNFYDVEDFGGNISSIITDPTDPNNKVMESLREATAMNFAGTIIGNTGLSNPIPFTETDKRISVRVWSPEAGVIVRLKVEDADNNAVFGEVDMISNVAQDWETIVFDFNNISGGNIDLANTYNKVVMFFNFGIPGASAGEQIYYWDDVKFAPLTQADLPITFEDNNVNYDLADFGGNTSSIVVDPTDPNNMVVQAIKGDMAEVSAGTTTGGGGLANAIPFNMNQTKMTVRVWSPNADTPIRMKVEDAADPNIFAEVEMSTIVAGEWETLEFDFTMTVAGTPDFDLANTYDKVSIFFNYGTTGADAGEQIYFFDDIMMVPSPLAQVDLPITFEDTNTDYNLGDFGNSVSMVVIDPTDPNNSVVETLKPDNAEPWAGVVAGGAGLANPIPYTDSNKTLSVRVWSPDAGITVRMKVEDAADSDIFAEVDMPTTVAGEWETLEFDFNNLAGGTLDLTNTYDKIAMFFNFNVTGVGDKTYYFDDIMFIPPVLDQVDLPITFEDPNTDYNLGDFGNSVSMIVVDPTDPNNSVVETLKPDNAEPWAGVVAGGAGLANPIPYTDSNKTLSVRVWSPDAGITVRMKVEDAADSDIFAEVDMPTTVAGEWETLEFDFNNLAGGTLDLTNTYDKIAMFFNFDVTGVGDKTYYFDDIMFDATPPLNQVDLPVTFEDPMVDYNFIDFDGNTSQLIVDPTDPTNMVMESTKSDNAGATAGTVIGNDAGFVNAVPFADMETKMNVRVWSPAADITILLKMENTLDPGIFVQTLTNTTKAMEWETLEFDFSNNVPMTPALDLNQTYDKGVIFFNFDISGADAGSLTFYWDDVKFGAGPVSVGNVATANINVSPNPANDFINIEFPEAIVAATSATLMDVSGKVMLHNEITTRLSQVNTADLSAGTYFLRIDTKTGSYYQKVMIVK